MREKTVRAPFARRLGVRQVDVGQYLAAGTMVVTLQALDPMFLDFYLPQQALGQIGVGQAVSVSVDAYPGKTFVGKVTSMNSKVDTSSNAVVTVTTTYYGADPQTVAGFVTVFRAI
jgi:membrane fusion protein (multidrug efflux system)